MLNFESLAIELFFGAGIQTNLREAHIMDAVRPERIPSKVATHTA
jgi:hypothetical protein